MVGSDIESERVPVYLFRAMHPSSRRSMLTCAAPLELVVSIYGGDGINGDGGLLATFGGVGVYRNDATGHCYLSVWGPRKAESFLATLRRSGAAVDLVRHAPPARLTVYTATH